MTIKYGNKTYITDNDLKVVKLGFFPRVDINDKKLKDFFEEEFGRTFLGGDELVAYAQSLVSKGMDFGELEKDILEDVENPDKKHLREIIFSKTATGIGRGHSLGGLSGVVLGVHGTKMIDSGLTGLCSSRSLVTSSRRRETGLGDIVIPESLQKHPELLKEYMQISEEVFNLGKEFKEKFGKMGGVETFNKVIPYNNPADLFIVLPLDTLSTIVSEVRQDELNPNGNFVPREIRALANELFDPITKEVGQNIMFKQRIEVPRDTYFHYTVFKDPSLPNYALSKAKATGMSLEPKVIDFSEDFDTDFIDGLFDLQLLFAKTKNIKDPRKLHKASLECMYALKSFSNEYNEAVRVKIADSLSWRVWSEQKRHATLRQNVESTYTAVPRASDKIATFWETIENAYQNNDFEGINKIMGELEKDIIIDDRLKKQKELILPYLYHTAKQLMFYRKLIDAGFEQRDALYITPKNIRVRTLEHYDLTNLINLELPLRLCDTCEPERKATSWKKRELMAEKLPELEYFLKSKCNVGFCTEGKYCKDITEMRDYNQELHKQTKQVMLSEAK